MYRGKLWTMRQFSGFATPEETNRRYHYLLEQGQTGLSVAFDLPTLMGYDADHAMSRRRSRQVRRGHLLARRHGDAVRGIPLGDVTVSMTINSPAAVLWAMYLAVAEQQGVDWARLSGTLQNDILKEYIAQKEYIYPPRPSMRLVTDTIEFSAPPHAALQSDFDQRLSHPRSRLDRRAGTGLHAARRHRVRGVGARARAGRSTSSRRA